MGGEHHDEGVGPELRTETVGDLLRGGVAADEQVLAGVDGPAEEAEGAEQADQRREHGDASRPPRQQSREADHGRDLREVGAPRFAG